MSDKYIFPHLIKVVNHPEGPEKKSELLHVQLVLHHLEQDHLGTPQTSQIPTFSFSYLAFEAMLNASLIAF